MGERVGWSSARRQGNPSPLGEDVAVGFANPQRACWVAAVPAKGRPAEAAAGNTPRRMDGHVGDWKPCARMPQNAACKASQKGLLSVSSPAFVPSGSPKQPSRADDPLFGCIGFQCAGFDPVGLFYTRGDCGDARTPPRIVIPAAGNRPCSVRRGLLECGHHPGKEPP